MIRWVSAIVILAIVAVFQFTRGDHMATKEWCEANARAARTAARHSAREIKHGYAWHRFGEPLPAPQLDERPDDGIGSRAQWRDPIDRVPEAIEIDMR